MNCKAAGVDMQELLQIETLNVKLSEIEEQITRLQSGGSASKRKTPEQFHFEVAVVGYGASGATAALAAIQGGANSVGLFEQFGGGGSAILSAGVIYAGGGTQEQNKHGVQDDPQNMSRYLMPKRSAAVSEEYVNRFCEDSAEHLTWLETSCGATFDGTLHPQGAVPESDVNFFVSEVANSTSLMVADDPLVAHQPAPPRAHRIPGASHTGNLLWKGLDHAVSSCDNVSLTKHCRCDALIMEAGAVVGVGGLILDEAVHELHQGLGDIGTACSIVSGANGACEVPLWHKCVEQERRLWETFGKPFETRVTNGVILCSGGFGFNRPMVQKYCQKYDGLCPLGTLGDQGLGIKMAQSAGAAVANMEQCSAWRFLHPRDSAVQGLLVDSNGSRLCNEQLYAATLGSLLMEKGGKGWLVMDDAMKSVLEAEAASSALGGLVASHLATSATRGDSMAELAQNCGMSLAILTQTVKVYNAGAESGIDAMGKQRTALKPIVESPFFALDMDMHTKAWPVPMMTLGGVQVEERTGQVLSETGNPIAGLFAAGRTRAGMVSEKYATGLSLADATYTGRMAGTAAMRSISFTESLEVLEQIRTEDCPCESHTLRAKRWSSPKTAFIRSAAYLLPRVLKHIPADFHLSPDLLQGWRDMRLLASSIKSTTNSKRQRVDVEDTESSFKEQVLIRISEIQPIVISYYLSRHPDDLDRLGKLKGVVVKLYLQRLFSMTSVFPDPKVRADSNRFLHANPQPCLNYAEEMMGGADVEWVKAQAEGAGSLASVWLVRALSGEIVMEKVEDIHNKMQLFVDTAMLENIDLIYEQAFKKFIREDDLPTYNTLAASMKAEFRTCARAVLDANQKREHDNIQNFEQQILPKCEAKIAMLDSPVRLGAIKALGTRKHYTLNGLDCCAVLRMSKAPGKPLSHPDTLSLMKTDRPLCRHVARVALSTFLTSLAEGELNQDLTPGNMIFHAESMVLTPIDFGEVMRVPEMRKRQILLTLLKCAVRNVYHDEDVLNTSLLSLPRKPSITGPVNIGDDVFTFCEEKDGRPTFHCQKTGATLSYKKVRWIVNNGTIDVCKSKENICWIPPSHGWLQIPRGFFLGKIPEKVMHATTPILTEGQRILDGLSAQRSLLGDAVPLTPEIVRCMTGPSITDCENTANSSLFELGLELKPMRDLQTLLVGSASSALALTVDTESFTLTDVQHGRPVCTSAAGATLLHQNGRWEASLNDVTMFRSRVCGGAFPPSTGWVNARTGQSVRVICKTRAMLAAILSRLALSASKEIVPEIEELAQYEFLAMVKLPESLYEMMRSCNAVAGTLDTLSFNKEEIIDLAHEAFSL